MKSKRKRNNNLKKAVKIGIAGIAGATALAAGTDAYARTVRYENTAIFSWQGFNMYEPDYNVLDITKPADEQPGLQGFTYSSSFYGGQASGTFFGIGTGFDIAVTRENFDDWAMAFESGEMIDGSIVFQGSGVGYLAGFNPYGSVYDIVWSVGFDKPEYIGLQILENDEVHYGWALVEWNSGWNALAWGYETDSNTGILAGAPTVVAEPGTLAMLATGAGTLLARRRLRKKK